MSFPYIKQIFINDCYYRKNLSVFKEEAESFKHVILTGRNGSGKTTVLKRINFLLMKALQGEQILRDLNRMKRDQAQFPTGGAEWTRIEEQIKQYADVSLEFFDSGSSENLLNNNIKGNEPPRFFKKNADSILFSFFPSRRALTLQGVNTVTNEKTILQELKRGSREGRDIGRFFNQFLVNKQIFELYQRLDGEEDSQGNSSSLLKITEKALSKIYNDPGLIFKFERKSFEFSVELSNGQKIPLKHFSDGFSAFFSIVLELLIKTEVIRNFLQDMFYEPSGIVLIDEPETHLHIEMQYAILPLISEMFPKIQLIIATHSPAIISSLENAHIFDISSGEELKQSPLTSSYSELMVGHFGLDNGYSDFADELFDKINSAYKGKDYETLKKIFDEYSEIFTPTFRLDLQSRLEILKDKIDQ